MRRAGNLILETLLVAALALPPATGHGQPAKANAPEAGEAPEYRELITRAVAELDAQNFAEALALFRRAHALSPSARTLRGIGIVEFELKNYADSVVQLELALSSNVKRLEGPLRKETEEALARARAYVARIDLELKPPGPHYTQRGRAGAQRRLGVELDDHLAGWRSALLSCAAHRKQNHECEC